MTTQTTTTRTPSAENREPRRPVYQPPVDIVETDEAVLLRADMPGVTDEGADITLDRNVLTIRGTVKPPQFDGYSLVHAEYGIGDYERAFTISSEVDRDGIEASLKNGVLTVKLPKASQAVARKIEISSA